MRKPVNIIRMTAPPLNQTKETNMSQVDDFQNRIDELQREMNRAINAKQEARFTKAIQNLQGNTQKLHHQLQSAPYVSYQESLAYIEGLKNEVIATGTVAVSALSGIKHSIKFLDETEAVTFSQITAGSTVEINGTQYIVTKFQHDYSGSKVSLLAMGSKALQTGVKTSPYGGINCNFDRGACVLTVPTHSRLTSPTVTIGKQLFQLTHTFLTSPPFTTAYQLQAV